MGGEGGVVAGVHGIERAGTRTKQSTDTRRAFGGAEKRRRVGERRGKKGKEGERREEMLSTS